MNLRKVIEAPFKAEITALHIGFNVLAFFMVLPSLGSETSGSPKSAALKVWEKGFRALERGFAELQLGQISLLSRAGLLKDEEFIGKKFQSYIYATNRNTTAEQRIEKLIGYNKAGVLSDYNAAQMIGEEGHSSDLSFGYDPQKKSFTTFAHKTDADIEKSNRAWDKMIGWASAKAENVAGLKGGAQAAFAKAIAHIFQQTPVGATEDRVIALSPRAGERGQLVVIFKEAVDRNSGLPMAATAHEAGNLKTLSQELRSGQEIERERSFRPESDFVVSSAQLADYLDAFAARPRAPKI